jgi:uroporphyrin-III C-methyltransferase
MIDTITIVHHDPRLTLVGAGPGDPDLLTLKGLKAIQQADVVLYDALVSDEIIDLIPNHVQSFSVGKRAGAHSFAQEEINELIVQLAYTFGHVVRLKGGDSFVFGRGMEEIIHAEQHGLRTAVIPGLSSAFSVPATLKIPLTSRGVSESFWVVTGATKDGVISGDVALAAKSTATVVILMGLKKIREIMEAFQYEGKGDLPVAVIQRHVVGTVSTIERLVAEQLIGSPAIIVLGEVVRQAQALNHVIAAVQPIASTSYLSIHGAE